MDDQLVLEILAHICRDDAVLYSLDYDFSENCGFDDSLAADFFSEVNASFGVSIAPGAFERESLRTPRDILRTVQNAVFPEAALNKLLNQPIELPT